LCDNYKYIQSLKNESQRLYQKNDAIMKSSYGVWASSVWTSIPCHFYAQIQYSKHKSHTISLLFFIRLYTINKGKFHSFGPTMYCVLYPPTPVLSNFSFLISVCIKSPQFMQSFELKVQRNLIKQINGTTIQKKGYLIFKSLKWWYHKKTT